MSIGMDQIYTTLAFLHTLAAMGLFAGMAIEAVAVRGLGQAGRTQPAREWIAVYRIALRLSMASMVLLFLAGLVMMAVRWGPAVWILTGIVALILTGLLGGLVSRSRIRAMAAQADSPTDSANAQWALRLSLWLRIGLVTGTVYVMTSKPGLAESLLVVSLATLLGASVGMLVARHRTATSIEGRSAAA